MLGIKGEAFSLRTLREYLVITLGLLTYTMGWTCFLIPMKITGGGASGIGSLIYYLTGFPVGYSFLIFNVLLIGIAMKVVGANFGVKTIYAVIVASALLAVEQLLITQPVLPNDRLLSSIIGGLMSGLGIGIAFSQGGSTGGTDIVAMLWCKYHNVSPGRVILATDAIIISSAFFVLADLSFTQRVENIVYGYLVMAVNSYAIDTYLNGIKQSLQVFIFSKDYEKVADRITADLHRGVTVVDGTGWYTKENTKVIITMLRKHEVNDLYKLVKQVDPKAFLSVASVMGVYGQGFENIRS
ncbi:MAG: YitT family protein [Bacteroidia bacterium]|mgnify:CR=1 FL=1|jgi:yitT family protein|nr:YitT family protein [Bacteroidia bacterium]